MSGARPPQSPGGALPGAETPVGIPPGWEAWAAEAARRRQALFAAARAARCDLPLRFLRQQAHYTVPASDFMRIDKAVTRGLSGVPALLERHGISVAATAAALGVGEDAVRAVLDGRTSAPLVLVDAEDAQAPGEAIAAQSRSHAVRAFTTLDWGSSLRFYRPSGLDQEACTGDLLTVLGSCGQGRDAAHYPLDGITWAKAERPEEIAWVAALLQEAERRLGLPPNRLRLQFLVESGGAVLRLAELVQAAGPRLCGIVFGIADYSADLGLAPLRNDHPACDWARAAIVAAAGAAGVPAIDAMTMRYPVADPSASATANREHILLRLRECFEDTRHGIALGMQGKWAGHPLQLFAVLLAHQESFGREDLERDIAAVEAYASAAAAGQGTSITAGFMSDRATDRQRRARLRRAAALGHLEPGRALALGVVRADEVSPA